MEPTPKSKADRLLFQVFETLDTHRMIRPEDSVLLAVSGGVDSVVLADMIDRYRRTNGIRTGVAHLNHGLRGANALRDARFVRDLAKARGVEFYYGKADVQGYRRDSGLSVEEAGRRMRYRFLTVTARRHGYSRIATGHHLDDNAEVVLMRFLSGSGRLGLSGIPLVRDGFIIRPLLGLGREEIVRYAAAMGLDFVEDETNADECYLRNRIRHRLMPFLKENFNPGISRALGRLAAICRDEDLLLNAMGENALEDAILSESKGVLTIRVDGMRRNGAAVERRMARAAIHRLKGDTRGFGLRHIDLIRRLPDSKEHPKTLHLPANVLATCDGVVLTLEISTLPHRKRPPRRDAFMSGATGQGYRYTVSTPGEASIPEIDGSMRFEVSTVHGLAEPKTLAQDKAFLDFDRIEFPMTVRQVRWDDRFCPLGMQGKQFVRKFLSDRKVSERKRRTWPVVTSGDRIVWVPGYRIEHAFRVTANTQKVLSVELFLA